MTKTINDKYSALYSIKTIPEDFIVNELPFYPELNNLNISSYTYLWLLKKNYNAFDVIGIIKTYFRVPFSEIGMAGLKDEDGITKQLISIKKIIKKDRFDDFNKKYYRKNDYINLTPYGYGKEAIRPRRLHGNSFTIVVRNIKKQLANKIYSELKTNRFFSFINYYDDQRFGLPSGPFNSHLIGKAIIDKHWEKAYGLFSASQNSQGVSKKLTSYKNYFTQVNPQKMNFFVSSYTSYLWNKSVADYVKKNAKTISYNLDNVCNLEIPSVKNSRLYSLWRVKGYEINGRNFRITRNEKVRNLVVNTAVYSSEPKHDDINKGRYKITLDFYLPTGCYATMLIKQLMISR